MDPVADVIALLSAGFAGLSLVIGQREVRKRQQWEHDQQKRQRAFTQPDLAPAGATLYGTGADPTRFSSEATQQKITIHNEGGSAPSQVIAVLFPSASYLVPGEVEPQRVEGLNNAYWYGQIDVSPTANQHADLTLSQCRYPLQGDQCLIAGVSLFAPPEPALRATLGGHATFYCARLTITYKDREGRTLAVAWDMHAMTRRWRRAIPAPTAVPD